MENKNLLDPIGTNQDQKAKPQAPTQILIPPPETQKFIETTASYVVKNGEEFENMILQQSESRQVVSFILKNDPYYPFY